MLAELNYRKKALSNMANTDKINEYISLLLACTSILSMSLLSSKLKTFISECPKTQKLHLKPVSHSETLTSADFYIC